MYHEFDEVRRIHQPYTDGFQRSKLHITHISSILTLYLLYSGLLEASSLQLPLHELEERHVRYD